MDSFSVGGLRFLDYGPITFSLEAGRTLGISGQSGSGKSLLLKSIADIIESEGEVILNDDNRWDTSADNWRSRVMLVPAETQWWYETVGEHIPEDSQPFWRELGFDDTVLKKPVIVVRE